MKKLKNIKNYYRVFTLGSVGALMLLATAFVAIPELDNDSFALTCSSEGIVTDAAGSSANVGDLCDTADLDVNVNIGEILDITAFTIDGTTYCDDGCDKTFDEAVANLGSATPGSSTINTEDVTVTVDTNVAAGYQLQIEGIKTVTAASSASNTDLVRSDDAGTDKAFYATIGTISGNMTKAQFEAADNGGWGYSLDSGNNYRAIPASATKAIGYDWVVSGGTATITKSTTFTFGARPSNSQTAGTYEGGIRFTAVAGSGNGS